MKVKRLTRHIKAFTLLESLFTLFLTAICLTGVYRGFGYLDNLLKKSAEKTRFISGYSLLSKAATNAFQGAEEIHAEGQKLTMRFYDSTKAELTISPTFLAFSQGDQSDTLLANCDFIENPSLSAKGRISKVGIRILHGECSFILKLENQLAAH